jgi:hypothetical protein
LLLLLCRQASHVGWPLTVILPISAFQVARLTGVSHWCPVVSVL